LIDAADKQQHLSLLLPIPGRDDYQEIDTHTHTTHNTKWISVAQWNFVSCQKIIIRKKSRRPISHHKQNKPPTPHPPIVDKKTCREEEEENDDGPAKAIQIPADDK
jgi:hypothetical protein